MDVQCGRVDILVVSANGRREPVPITQMTEEHWRFVIDVARLAAKLHHADKGAEQPFRVLATFNPMFVGSVRPSPVEGK